MFVLNFIVLQIDIILVQTIMQNKQVKVFPQYCHFKHQFSILFKFCTLCQQVLAVTSERSSFEM